MLRIMLAISLAASLAIAPSSARARFGKSDDDRTDSDSAKKAHPATPAAPPRRVEAHPPREVEVHYRPPRVWSPPPRPVVLTESPVYYAPPPSGVVYYPRPPPPLEPSVVAPVRFRFEAGVEGQGHAQGGTLGFLLRLEGERLGIHSEYAVIFAGSPDAVDAIGLFDAHLTYALLAGERGRLRVEAGIDCASAPELKVVGPDAGLSAGLRLLGPLGVEAAAYFTPVPFRRLEARAGATLTFGHLALRAGVKSTLLDDAGLVDGVQHVDIFSGPYAGLALVF
jgi:hypothetical protein